MMLYLLNYLTQNNIVIANDTYVDALVRARDEGNVAAIQHLATVCKQKKIPITLAFPENHFYSYYIPVNSYKTLFAHILDQNPEEHERIRARLPTRYGFLHTVRQEHNLIRQTAQRRLDYDYEINTMRSLIPTHNYMMPDEARKREDTLLNLRLMMNEFIKGDGKQSQNRPALPPELVIAIGSFVVGKNLASLRGVKSLLFTYKDAPKVNTPSLIINAIETEKCPVATKGERK